MMPLREFLKSLVQSGRYNQSEIARRAGVSQSVVNKIIVGNSSREPAPATYRGICTAFSVEWEKFLFSHAKFRENLAGTYGWAVPARLTARNSERTCAQNPAVEEAAQQIGQVLDALLDEVEGRLRLLLEPGEITGSRARVLDEEIAQPEGDILSPLGSQPGDMTGCGARWNQ